MLHPIPEPFNIPEVTNLLTVKGITGMISLIFFSSFFSFYSKSPYLCRPKL